MLLKAPPPPPPPSPQLPLLPAVAPAGRRSREERIEFAHQLFFGRPPKPAEQQLAEDYLSGANSREEQLTAWSQLCQALYASVDFRYVR